LRIAIHTQYYPPEMGAPQARLSELARRFVERGHEVIILTAMPNYPRGKVYPGYGGLVRREEKEGIRILRTFVYPTQSLGTVRRMASYLSFVASSFLAGSAMLPPIDYLMTESPPLFLGLSGYALSRLESARWIFNVSDLWPESAQRLGLVGEGWALRLSKRLEAFCYRKAWLVTGQSRGILDDITRRFPAVSTYHLSGGVDTNLFRPDHPVPAGRDGLGSDDDCIAVYTGLHGAAQGLDQILDAAARLVGVDGFRVVMIGDGPEKKRLMARARELQLGNVGFLDPVPRDRMPGVLAAADIGLACLRETLPGAIPSKIYEIMGAGRPLVLVAGGEPAEIVRRHGCGLAVAPGDSRGVSDALLRLMKDPDLCREMGARGREAASARFDRCKIVDAFVDFLEKGEVPE
jgi:glycosyltransferase involved in cell wall biosynthesis